MTDRTLGETIHLKFTTRAFATGIPTTLSGTPVLSAYEDASTTQITAGVSITVDLDGVTGFNLATIVATGGNGFEAGKQYGIVITTGTVGGVSVVGETVDNFTLEASAAFTRLGAPAGASVSADIADVPTVAEFNARTIAAADYFDPATDAVANVTLVATTTTNTDMRGTDGANTTVPDNASIAAILVDTAEIGAAGAGLTDLGGMSTAMKGEVNAEADTALTDYDGPTNAEMEARTLLAANYFDPAADAVANVTLVDTTTTNSDAITVSDIQTTQMTEAYAADGVAPTLAQAIFLIQQTIGDFAITGTTITAKKLDGSTAAATYTLDDGTNPTSRTRST